MLSVRPSPSVTRCERGCAQRRRTFHGARTRARVTNRAQVPSAPRLPPAWLRSGVIPMLAQACPRSAASRLHSAAIAHLAIRTNAAGAHTHRVPHRCTRAVTPSTIQSSSTNHCKVLAAGGALGCIGRTGFGSRCASFDGRGSRLASRHNEHQVRRTKGPSQFERATRTGPMFGGERRRGHAAIARRLRVAEDGTSLSILSILRRVRLARLSLGVCER